MRTTRTLMPICLAIVAVLGTGGASLAQPVTETHVEKFAESFADEAFLCQDELYETSVSGHTLTHVTAASMDGNGNPIPPLHFHFLTHAKVVSVPVDGTGPTFTGHFRTSDTESIRNVKQGDVFVETDTDLNSVVAKGSDGSMVTLHEHHHFTFNANGEVTTEFEKVTASC